MPKPVRSSLPLRGHTFSLSLSALASAALLVCAGAAQANLNNLLVQQPGGAEIGTAPEAGMARVIVQFREAPVSRMRQNMDVLRADRNEMRVYAAQLRAAKAARLAAVNQMGGRVQNTLEYVINGAVVDIPRNRIATLQRMPGVKSVRLAQVYQMGQSTPTVGELITTAQVNAAGNRGAGVAIAVIDSGVDYTHAAFGGPGTVAVYQSNIAGANPTTLGAHNAGLFPGGPRVKGGYDWLGDTWCGAPDASVGCTGTGPALAVTPDPNPIDNKQRASDFAGHGTNSASAAAGMATSGGLRDGSAPQAFLLAYRGCSRISRSCEGSALLNSVESVIRYAAGNPNDGQPGANNPTLPAGTRFVINMSLGASYGNPQIDDLAEASRNAVRAGITVVASAGNSGDIPFIVGTPSSADQLISVAASQPALLTGPTVSAGSLSFPLTPAAFGSTLTSPLTLPLAFAGNSTVQNLACVADRPNIPSLAGAAGVADRGVCAFVDKAVSMQQKGAALGLVVNNQPGTLTMAGADPTLTSPYFLIDQLNGNALKSLMTAGPVSATFAPAGDLPNLSGSLNLVDQLSDFTSRGPAQNNFALKPDITAPGSNIFMASVGTGTLGAPSSGTSFSGPLTAGAAALVLAARPTLTPWQVKAALMNTANPNVFQTKSTGLLAATTRMGAGRVDAQRAVNTQTLAYDSEDVDPGAAAFFNSSLSFGEQAFTSPGANPVSRTVVVQNLGNAAKTYRIGISSRFANDTAKGIVWETSTDSLTVGPNSTGTFKVTAKGFGSQLPTSGGLPVRLLQTDTCTTATNPPQPVASCTGKFNDIEQDGFVTIDGGADTDRVSVPFLMVPRQASQVGALRIGTSVLLRNTGVANSVTDVFNLVGAPDPQDLPAPTPGAEELPIDIRAVGVRYTAGAVTTPPAGISGDVLEFAITTWRPLDTLRLATFNIELDTNGDGVTDFTVRNLNTTTNQSAVFISAGVNGAPGNAFFFTNAPLYSTRAVLPVFTTPLGITAGSRIGIRVRSTNGWSPTFAFPTLDRAPDSGGFEYVKLDQLANQPSARFVTTLSSSANRFAFTTSAANRTASPGDKGLLLLHGENPTGADSTALQLVP
jgi:subtilisin family serine protease